MSGFSPKRVNGVLFGVETRLNETGSVRYVIVGPKGGVTVLVLSIPGQDPIVDPLFHFPSHAQWSEPCDVLGESACDIVSIHGKDNLFLSLHKNNQTDEIYLEMISEYFEMFGP